jgi:hypothetical protein
LSHEAEQDPSVLMEAATRQVGRLNRAVSRYRLFTIILGVVCAGLVAGGVVLGVLWESTHEIVAHQAQVTRAQAEQAYQGCLAGDDYRADNEQIWVYFVKLVTKGKANPEAAQFLRYVDRVDAARDCAALRPPAG